MDFPKAQLKWTRALCSCSAVLLAGCPHFSQDQGPSGTASAQEVLLHLGQAAPSPCLEPWGAQAILEQPKISRAVEVQHLSQPTPLLPPTAPALHLWPLCSPTLHIPSSGSLQALHQPSRTIPSVKLSAKPFIPLSCSHRSPGRDPHEHLQCPRGNSCHGCPIVPAPRVGARPVTWAEVLDQKPQASAVPSVNTATSKSRQGIKKIRCFVPYK